MQTQLQGQSNRMYISARYTKLYPEVYTCTSSGLQNTHLPCRARACDQRAGKTQLAALRLPDRPHNRAQASPRSAVAARCLLDTWDNVAARRTATQAPYLHVRNCAEQGHRLMSAERELRPVAARPADLLQDLAQAELDAVAAAHTRAGTPYPALTPSLAPCSWQRPAAG